MVMTLCCNFNLFKLLNRDLVSSVEASANMYRYVVITGDANVRLLSMSHRCGPGGTYSAHIITL